MQVKGMMDANERAEHEKKHNTTLVSGYEALADALDNQVSSFKLKMLAKDGVIGFYHDAFKRRYWFDVKDVASAIRVHREKQVETKK